MKIKVTIETTLDTVDQDDILKLALEKLAWDVGTTVDRRLVLIAISARAVPSDVKIELL